MTPITQRVLQAYRPLCLNGLLKDGPCRWRPASDTETPLSPKPQMLLLALASVGSRHLRPRRRS